MTDAQVAWAQRIIERVMQTGRAPPTLEQVVDALFDIALEEEAIYDPVRPGVVASISTRGINTEIARRRAARLGPDALCQRICEPDAHPTSEDPATTTARPRLPAAMPPPPRPGSPRKD